MLMKMMMMTRVVGLLLALVVVLQSQSPLVQAKVHSQVLRRLETQHSADIVIVFKQSSRQEVLHQVNRRRRLVAAGAPTSTPKRDACDSDVPSSTRPSSSSSPTLPPTRPTVAPITTTTTTAYTPDHVRAYKVDNDHGEKVPPPPPSPPTDTSIELNRDDQRIDNVMELQEEAYQLLQKPVLELLQTGHDVATPRNTQPGGPSMDADTTQADQYWVTSNLYVSNATADVVSRISLLDSVQEIREPIDFVAADTDNPPTAEHEDEFHKKMRQGCNGYLGTNGTWNVERLHVPQVWAMGYTGTNVRVGIIDTGVHHNHEAIRDAYIGEYGWFDPLKHSQQPNDESGHGTVTASVVVGRKVVGVAPDAKWMACKACRGQSCPEEAVIKCVQFMACPSLPDGSKKDCSKRPHVINNSFGGWSDDRPVLRDIINSMTQAGIVPVFAAGNIGPACNSMTFPARMAEVIAVGATDNKDKLLELSSKGMADETIKPDLSAPGQSICVANHKTTDQYTLQRGTSVAAPHVTGVIALLLSSPRSTSTTSPTSTSTTSPTSKSPGSSTPPYHQTSRALTEAKLDVNQIKSLLFSTTDQESLAQPDLSCSANFKEFPNVDYGHGLVDALAVMQKYLSSSSLSPSTNN